MRRCGLIAAMVLGLGVPLCPGSWGKVRAQDGGYRPLPAGEPMPVPTSPAPRPPPAPLKWGPTSRPPIAATDGAASDTRTNDGTPAARAAGTKSDALGAWKQPAPVAAADSKSGRRPIADSRQQAPAPAGAPAPMPQGPAAAPLDLPLSSPAGTGGGNGKSATPSGAMPMPNGLSPAPPWGTTSTSPAVSTGMPPERSASGNGSLRTAVGGTSPPGSVTVETIGPATVMIGTPLTYEVVARNQTSTALGNVRVENEPPAGARVLSVLPRPDSLGERIAWNVGTLEAGGERRFQVQVQPVGDAELRSCSTATFAVSGCLRTVITQPKLALSKSGPQRVMIGEKAVFDLEITNIGNAPATGVVLHDQLPEGLQHEHGGAIDMEVGTMAPRETKRMSLETKAVRRGVQLNHATVTADNAAPVAAEATVVVTAPALTLRKTGPSNRFVNREAEFDLEVSNPGNAPAKNVRVTDELPPGLTFVEASSRAVYAADKRTITWDLGTLLAGARRGLTVKVVAKAPGDFINRAVAQGDPGLEATAEAPLHAEGVPALLLEVVDLDDPVEVGAETTYEIRVVNQGTCASQGLRIIATIPDGMTPRSAAGPAPYRIEGQQVVFEPLATLAARADALFRIRVLCRTAGDWRFKVQMKCDQLSLPVHEEESTRIYKD